MSFINISINEMFIIWIFSKILKLQVINYLSTSLFYLYISSFIFCAYLNGIKFSNTCIFHCNIHYIVLSHRHTFFIFFEGGIQILVKDKPWKDSCRIIKISNNNIEKMTHNPNLSHKWNNT